jgi:hypothetical protein
MWIVLLIFITVLLFLLYVLFSKTRPVTFISTYKRNLKVGPNDPVLPTLIYIMALPVMEFQDQGYKIRNIFA